MHPLLHSALICVALPGAFAAGAGESAAAFRHPGILLNRAQLDLIKQRVTAGAEPQTTAFATLLASPLADLEYRPSPRATVECGPRSNPELGCQDERRDSAAAYSQAIAWCVTGKAEYARTAIRIMNAWSGTLTGGHTLANGPVQAAGSASVWPRAAEIVRHTSDFWPPGEIARFEKINVAETGRQQGRDLYAEQSRRIVAAMEFQAQFLPPNSATPPANLVFSLQPTWEIAFNHLHHRLGIEFPFMAQVIPTNRPTGADNNHMVWETLTHGKVGAVGLPPLPSPVR